MVNKRSQIGKTGENIACKYLVDKAYKILYRNYWQSFGEIDIIARDPDKTLVFVEVKTLSELGQSTVDNSVDNSATLPLAELVPEENLTVAKYKKLAKICEWFSRRFPDLINEKKGWRIDLLALTIDKKSCQIRHYKNI